MSGDPTVAALLDEATERLRAGDVPAPGPELDAQLLLAHSLGVRRVRLRSHPETVVPATAARRFRELLRRRVQGEPVAYLTGIRDFWSLPLAVTPAVLVPRPETELLVERALALHAGATARVADLGTGSGAIALALATERPGWQLVATDLSAAALAVARANAAALGLTGVKFRQGDWFAPLAGGRFDLLISNPPYVAGDDPALAALAFEPRAALTPGPDALACLRLLARGAPRHLVRGGWLLLEHGADQGAAVRRELVLAGFSHVGSQRDLAGHERMTEGQHDQI
ncbi:MAG TPA: peptide chain release factor N(5)-glutamine methyltransferase [Steroidobacteraceae bacterium]|nr:peptide chain release factor N(5)-glutamine methyltransferase [Steroidobacteraceae bacterium]